jgi:DUF4097 and DUF4098 domain-containing protein YvlB
MRKAAIAFVVLAVAVILAGPAFASEEVFQRTYPLPAGGTFELQNVNGSVVVSGWDRNEVEIHAVKTARRNSEDLQRVKIEVQAQAGKVSVHTRYPQDEGVEVTVEYRVHVPRRVILGRVNTVNGAVRVAGVDGSGDLQSVNGDVEALDSAGRFRAHTTNGNVRLELRGLSSEGVLAAETVNGSVVLALPEGAGGELDVRSLNGDFRSELPVTLQGSLGAREFHGRLGQGGAPIRIRTVNGSVRIVTLRATV